MESPQGKGAGHFQRFKTALALSFMLGGFAAGVGADQVEMKSGDRLVGSVTSVSSDTVVLQNETLGTVRLPRRQVSTIAFGPLAAAGATNGPHVAASAAPGAPAKTNAAVAASETFKHLAGNSNLVQQVQAQFLAGAGPEANARFNELLEGLMSGKLSVSDIRAQAQTAAEQLRAAKKELGNDAGFALDGYLAILDHFLKETSPAEKAVTNPRGPSLTAKGGQAGEE